MENRIKSLEKHIDFLYDELESKEKEVEQVKESHKHADELCRKNTAYAQEILVEKCSLSQLLEKKEVEIHELKSKDSKCQNGCERMEEVMQYAAKNKNDVISLKEIAESQKVKISCLRRHRNELQDQLDKKDSDHETEQKDRNDKISYLQEENDSLKDQIDDQKGEIEAKTKEIETLLKSAKNRDELEPTLNCLADEISLAKSEVDKENMGREIKVLKKKIVNLEKSRNGVAVFNKQLDKLGEKRKEDLAKLKSSIKNLKATNKQKCKFGWACRKSLFCKFDHTYLYSKVNYNKPKGSDQPIFRDPPNLLCEMCGKTFKTKDKFEHHIEGCKATSNTVLRNVATQNSQNKQCECEICLKIFSNNLHLKKHKQEEHANDEISCSECGKYFISKEELMHHEKTEHGGQKLVDEDISDLLKVLNNLADEEPEQSNEKKEIVKGSKKSCQLKKLEESNECMKSTGAKIKMKKHKKKKHEQVKHEISTIKIQTDICEEINSDDSEKSFSSSFSTTSSFGSESCSAQSSSDADGSS